MRRAIGIYFAGLAAVVTAAIACDGFGEGDPSDSTDAGTDVTPSNPIDAQSDAAADVVVDAALAPPFCSTADASFCWSFDELTNGSALYGPTFAARGGPVSLTPMARSAPNAMLAEGDGGVGQWLLTMPVPATQSVTCTMAVFFEEITSDTEVLTFRFASGVTAFEVQPLPDPASVRSFLVVDRTGPQVVQGLPNLPTKQWIDVALAVQRANNGYLLAASALGTAVTADLRDAGVDPFEASPDLDVGYFAGLGGKGSVRIDNVRCSYQ